MLQLGEYGDFEIRGRDEQTVFLNKVDTDDKIGLKKIDIKTAKRERPPSTKERDRMIPESPTSELVD